MQRTEPMAIGSPTSPMASGTNRQQTAFLPPFLMGDSSYSMPLTPPSKPWCSASSPGRSSSLNRSNVANPNAVSFLNSSRNELVAKEGTPKSPGRKRAGGPPVRGLFEMVLPNCGSLPYKLESNESQQQQHWMTPSQDSQQFPVGGSSSVSSAECNSAGRMRRVGSMSQLQSPIQHDSYYVQGESMCVQDEDRFDETWITIYGFPVGTESFIIQEFSAFGTIVKHRVPSEGNWIHVQFQNKLQARKALSRHGKILSGNIMIGVKQCDNKDVVELNKENYASAVMKATCMNASSITASGGVVPQEFCGRAPKPSSFRPLTSSLTETQKSPSAQDPQQQSNGIVSKALGFVLGW